MAGGQALQGVRLPTATEMGWQGHSPGTDTEPQQRAGARPESTRGRTFASVMALWGRRDVIGTHAAFGQRGQSRQLANDPVPCLPPPPVPMREMLASSMGSQSQAGCGSMCDDDDPGRQQEGSQSRGLRVETPRTQSSQLTMRKVDRVGLFTLRTPVTTCHR